ncbi:MULTISPECIES: helix-turn-helix domain-containing protein [Streptomyces]|uniref:Helix-turn-helix domain-containing protein n=1 Tax=Streptomyces griseiscabiei TaxID=2993540 RepID=A0ABU4KVF9_9ACTN|nr:MULTISPECIES: helix-turn-helix domain-containing protein [Streptomyces]MBZ3902978.1 helix-turn-helix domain-containing protein [Streptomyces griseiscabiei]MDX2907289.1 helix-turn-helix domain-containing protein [Streptomyces griseiscabiei]
MSDNELAAFLRSRREAITPADVGLPTGPRRRAPGLRRAELATLAGISVEYLTRLEQGRDRNPSSQVLGALADALRLRVPDRVLLRRLSKESGDGLLCSAPVPPARTVRPTVRALLDRLEPSPAVLLNWLGDIVAHTTGYERYARPLGLLDGTPPNVLRYLFTDERARTVYPGWERLADEQVAHLRHEAPLHDPHVAALADELTVTAGARFTLRLKGVPAMPLRNGTDLVEHPEAGRLRLSYETLALPDDGQRLMVHLPADEATATALDHLNGRKPGALRAVGG